MKSWLPGALVLVTVAAAPIDIPVDRSDQASSAPACTLSVDSWNRCAAYVRGNHRLPPVVLDDALQALDALRITAREPFLIKINGREPNATISERSLLRGLSSRKHVLVVAASLSVSNQSDSELVVSRKLWLTGLTKDRRATTEIGVITEEQEWKKERGWWMLRTSRPVGSLTWSREGQRTRLLDPESYGLLTVFVSAEARVIKNRSASVEYDYALPESVRLANEWRWRAVNDEDMRAGHLVGRVTCPTYSAFATQAWIQGNVDVSILVDATGRVADVRVVKGVSGLIESATEAIRNWSFDALTTAGDRPRQIEARVVFFLRKPTGH